MFPFSSCLYVLFMILWKRQCHFSSHIYCTLKTYLVFICDMSSCCTTYFERCAYSNQWCLTLKYIVMYCMTICLVSCSIVFWKTASFLTLHSLPLQMLLLYFSIMNCWKFACSFWKVTFSSVYKNFFWFWTSNYLYLYWHC